MSENQARRTIRTDGRARIALLVPSSNTVMENDLHHSLPKDRFTIHVDRMHLLETTREAEILMIEEHAKPAAKDVGAVDPDLIIFGCTSAGSLFGLDYDARICRELGEIAGCEALGVISAVSETLNAAKAKQIALITPYIDDLTRSVAKSLEAPDREIVAAHGMGISVNVELADPTPEDIVAFARSRLTGQTFDTLFVSCTNFRALEAKAMLESMFGVPVITSNSAVVDTVAKRFP